MSQKNDFILSEDVDGVFREICKAYGLDASLLSWQFEKHIILNGATPFRFNTNDFVNHRPLKDAVDKVVVEVEYANANANDIKWIRFHEMPCNKYYIVTQTSMRHIRQDSNCPLWLELPQESRKEDMATVQNFLNVDICCEEWKDFLPDSPETALERALLVFASEDVDWMKKQLIQKDAVIARLTNTLAFKNIEMVAVNKEVENLKGKLDEKLSTKQEMETEKAELRAVIKELEAQLAEKADLLEALDSELPQTPPRSKKRKIPTPKSQVGDVVNQDGRHPIPDTPTRKGARSPKSKK